MKWSCSFQRHAPKYRLPGGVSRWNRLGRLCRLPPRSPREEASYPPGRRTDGAGRSGGVRAPGGEARPGKVPGVPPPEDPLRGEKGSPLVRPSLPGPAGAEALDRRGPLRKVRPVPADLSRPGHRRGGGVPSGPGKVHPLLLLSGDLPGRRGSSEKRVEESRKQERGKSVRKRRTSFPDSPGGNSL